MNSKPRRAQGVLGLLSHTISVQKSQESILKILNLERKEGGGDRKEEEGATAGCCSSGGQPKKKREKEGGGEGGF